MFVKIIFGKESINGELIFMFMTKNVIIYPFSVFKLKKFEISSNFSLSWYFADFLSGRRNLHLVYTLNGPGHNTSSNIFI